MLEPQTVELKLKLPLPNSYLCPRIIVLPSRSESGTVFTVLMRFKGKWFIWEAMPRSARRGVDSEA